MRSRLIVRIKGGLGNQLFAYAAARRLAIVNNAELVIDDQTGFVRDDRYRRRYELDHFEIPARKATRSERMEPFERIRRGVAKWLSRRKPFEDRRYIEQVQADFDERLLAIGFEGTRHIDGIWASEGYFRDVERIVRSDLRMVPPCDSANLQMAGRILESNAVALHVRWFDGPINPGNQCVEGNYFGRAISVCEERLGSPHYFLFSDNAEAARAAIALPTGRVTYVSLNREPDSSYADLWLMTKCKHFITSNSTFSWWGAWLGQGEAKIVVCPRNEIKANRAVAWSSSVQVPREWLQL